MKFAPFLLLLISLSLASQAQTRTTATAPDSLRRRGELPLEERLRIRSFQGEFHTLRGARQVTKSLN